MKICHILWGLTYGGIETMCINIANEQALSGHKVHFVIINDKTDAPMFELIDPAVRVHRLRRPAGSRNPLHLLRLNLLLATMRPDVVHLHHVQMYKCIFTPMLKHWCTTVHIDFWEGLRPYLSSNPTLYAISDHVRNDILAKTGVDSVVVYNGIDPRPFVRKTAYYQGGRTFRIVQIGRLNLDHKGQDILIRAVMKLRSRGFDVHADFIGEGPDRSAIEALIAELGAHDCVTLLGSRVPEYIHNHLADYDLLAQPSRMEGFGLTIAEGMAAGVPVLVSDVEAQLEVIDHGRVGYSFKSADAQSCADAIEFIIKNYDADMAARALEHVQARYDVRTTAARYVEQYQRRR